MQTSTYFRIDNKSTIVDMPDLLMKTSGSTDMCDTYYNFLTNQLQSSMGWLLEIGFLRTSLTAEVVYYEARYHEPCGQHTDIVGTTIDLSGSSSLNFIAVSSLLYVQDIVTRLNYEDHTMR